MSAPDASATQQERAHTEFAESLEALFTAVLRASGRGVPGGATELTISQYNVLSAVGERVATVTEIAAAADLAVPTATRSLRALEERGFVRRRRGENGDGRVVTVSQLTGSIRALLESLPSRSRPPAAVCSPRRRPG